MLKIFFFVSLLIFISCKSYKADDHRDPFYTDPGFSQKRLPLLKPYDLKKISNTEWRMDLQTTQMLALSIHNVTGVNVTDSTILLQSQGGTDFNNLQDNECWFVIQYKKNMETGYSNYHDYSKELSRLSILDTLLVSPDSTYDKFYITRLLKWINEPVK
jgi:hypothetical protein